MAKLLVHSLPYTAANQSIKNQTVGRQIFENRLALGKHRPSTAVETEQMAEARNEHRIYL
jgi:hypothetical protein